MPSDPRKTGATPARGELFAAIKLVSQWREEAALPETPPERARILRACADELELVVARTGPLD
jgi:hypothetical protein